MRADERQQSFLNDIAYRFSTSVLRKAGCLNTECSTLQNGCRFFVKIEIAFELIFCILLNSKSMNHNHCWCSVS